MSHCKSCNADVFYVRSEHGRMMILNATPETERGNVRVQPGRDGDVGRVLNKQHAARIREGTMEALYLSHFATCPQSQSWHRKSA